MTIYDVISELFRFNLDELNYALDLKLKIKFKNEYFIIVDDENKIIFKDKTLNYGFDLKNQRKFILKVANKIFKFFKDSYSAYNMKCRKLKVNELEGIYKVIGLKHYMYFKHIIKVERGKFNNIEEYKKYMLKIFDNIDDNLDNYKLNIFLYTDELDVDYLYVGINICNKELPIYYVDKMDIEIMDNILNSVKKLLRTKYVTIYYSNVDEKEADKAVEYIESLLNKKG